MGPNTPHNPPIDKKIIKHRHNHNAAEVDVVCTESRPPDPVPVSLVKYSRDTDADLLRDVKREALEFLDIQSGGLAIFGLLLVISTISEKVIVKVVLGFFYEDHMLLIIGRPSSEIIYGVLIPIEAINYVYHFV